MPPIASEATEPGHWCTAHKAGGFQHITLEEADATLWAAEAKLRRPTELFARSALGGDNAPCVGAFRRGRSRSRRLNGRCRRRAAVELAGGFSSFDVWVPTHANPTDRPSRAHLHGRAHRDPDQPEPRSEVDLGRLPAGPCRCTAKVEMSSVLVELRAVAMTTLYHCSLAAKQTREVSRSMSVDKLVKAVHASIVEHIRRIPVGA